MTVLGPEFQHDLFVSYASGDSEHQGSTQLKTWSLGLAKALKEELLLSFPRRDFNLYIDESDRYGSRLQTHEPLTPQLRDAIQASALFLYLISPHYLFSGWCRQERKWWRDQISRAVFPEVANREFFARIWPVGRDEWPRELCDETGEPPIGTTFFDPPGDSRTSRPYWLDRSAKRFKLRPCLIC